MSNVKSNEKNNTIRVALEIPPPLALIFGMETERWHVIHREVTEGVVLGDFLTFFALSHPEFRRGIFDPVKRELNSGLSLTLNGVLLDVTRKLDSELIDGDHVTIVPDHFPVMKIEEQSP